MKFYLNDKELMAIVNANKNHIPAIFRDVMFNSGLKIKCQFNEFPKQYSKMSGSCFIINYDNSAYEINTYYDCRSGYEHYVIFKYDYDNVFYSHSMDLLLHSNDVNNFNNSLPTNKVCSECYEIGV